MRRSAAPAVHARLPDPTGFVVACGDTFKAGHPLAGKPVSASNVPWTRDADRVTCRACRARLARYPQLKNRMVQEEDVEAFADHMAEIAGGDDGR